MIVRRITSGAIEWPKIMLLEMSLTMGMGSRRMESCKNKEVYLLELV